MWEPSHSWQPVFGLDCLDYLVLGGCIAYGAIACIGLIGAAFWRVMDRFRQINELPTNQNLKVLVVLIHGTWSLEPAWTQTASPLATTIRRALSNNENDIQFVHFRWSGRNTQYARDSATRQLVSWLNTNRSSDPGQRVVLVGHSYGGNIAIGAAAQLEASTPISKVVTLATPFIVTSKRSFAPSFQLGFAMAAAFFSCLVVRLAFHSFRIDPPFALVISPGPFVMLAGFFAELQAIKAKTFTGVEDWSASVSKKTLIVRSADDEASSVLGFVSLSATLAFHLLHRMFYPFEWLNQKVTDYWTQHPKADRAVDIFWVLLFIGGVVAIPLSSKWSGLDNVLRLVFSTIFITFMICTPLLFKGLIGAIYGTALGALVAFTAPLFVLPLTLYGWDMMCYGFHLRFSAEATPQGRWDVLLSTVNSNAANEKDGTLRSAISHSYVYENPHTLSELSKWLKTGI